jgi:hypothetical protein
MEATGNTGVKVLGFVTQLEKVKSLQATNTERDRSCGHGVRAGIALTLASAPPTVLVLVPTV